MNQHHLVPRAWNIYFVSSFSNQANHYPPPLLNSHLYIGDGGGESEICPTCVVVPTTSTQPQPTPTNNLRCHPFCWPGYHKQIRWERSVRLATAHESIRTPLAAVLMAKTSPVRKCMPYLFYLHSGLYMYTSLGCPPPSCQPWGENAKTNPR